MEAVNALAPGGNVEHPPAPDLHPMAAIALERLSSARTDAPYALVDYPNYLNPGDAAIWCGTVRLLQRLNGRLPSYVSTLKAFSPARCRAAIGDGTVYFLGGGNFGDLYPRHHGERLRVMRAMAGHVQVHLPFSLALRHRATTEPDHILSTPEALRRAVFFAREAQTAGDLAAKFGIDATVCPDLAHGLAMADPPAPVTDVVHLLRNDRERLSDRARPVQARDWSDLRLLKLVNRLGKVVLLPPFAAHSLAVAQHVAGAKVAIARRFIARGRRLVTDRLHAMILAQQIGREVWFCDNATGKLSSYVETWRGHLDGVAIVPAPERAATEDGRTA